MKFVIVFELNELDEVDEVVAVLKRVLGIGHLYLFTGQYAPVSGLNKVSSIITCYLCLMRAQAILLVTSKEMMASLIKGMISFEAI